MMIMSLEMNLQKLEKNIEILVIEGGVWVNKERKGEERERESERERERKKGENRGRVT